MKAETYPRIVGRQKRMYPETESKCENCASMTRSEPSTCRVRARDSFEAPWHLRVNIHVAPLRWEGGGDPWHPGLHSAVLCRNHVQEDDGFEAATMPLAQPTDPTRQVPRACAGGQVVASAHNGQAGSPAKPDRRLWCEVSVLDRYEPPVYVGCGV